MKTSTLVLVLLLCTALLTWIAVVQIPDGLLHIVFLDVESGQGLLIRTPTGRVVLIDGGPRPSAVLSALGRHLPFWERTLDLIVCTHPGNNALLPALEVARRYRVISALFPLLDSHPPTALLRLHETMKQRGVTIHDTQEGTVVRLNDGLLIEIIMVTDGLSALRLSYGQVSVLLPGSVAALPHETNATVIAIPISNTTNPNIRLPDGVSVIFFNGKRSSNHVLPPVRGNMQTFSTASHGSLELVSNGQDVTIRPTR